VRRPIDGRVEVSHDLRVGRLRNDLANQLLHLRNLARVTLTREELRRDREVAQLGQAAAHAFDVLVRAEDLVHHEQHRQLFFAVALWVSAIGRVRGVLDRGKSSSPR